MKLAQLLGIVAVASLSGCGGDSIERSPPTDVRLFNASPSFELVAFLREEEALPETTLQFTGASSQQYDSGQYDFHLEYSQPGIPIPFRAFSFSEILSPNFDYTFIAAGGFNSLVAIVVANDNSFSSTTTTRLRVVNAHTDLGAVDVYVEPPGTDLAAVAERAQIAYRDASGPFEVTPNTYRLFLTTANDPADVLYESADMSIEAGGDALWVVSGDGGQGLSDIIVHSLGPPISRIPGLNEGSAVRVAQSVNDQLTRDVLLDGQTMPVFVESLPTATLTDFLPISSGTHDLSATPAGNPGVIEETESLSALPGRLYTVLFAGDETSPSAVESIAFLEDLRPISGQATLRLINGAGVFNLLEIFVTLPGTDINDRDPNVILNAPGLTSRLNFIPGDYELTVRDPETNTVVAGPQPLALDSGGVHGILIVNGVGGSTVDFVYYDDVATP